MEALQLRDNIIEWVDIEQGSPEWFALRKTKITATDAGAILGTSYFKTDVQLYHEKLSNDPPQQPTERMKRGTDLEPIARSLFNYQTGLNMRPAVAVRGWAMASFDGYDPSTGHVLEIKCPGEKDHAVARSGRVPTHYYAQIQHQLYVSGALVAYYFSFDGIDGVSVVVHRDDEFIKNMVVEEHKFYERLLAKEPPESKEDRYVRRDEEEVWVQVAANLIAVQNHIKVLEEQEERWRNQLIFLSGGSNSKGGGISLCQVSRKGAVDYAKVPELRGVNLEPYRKASSISWRITRDV